MLKFFERFKQDHPPVDLASITSHLALDLTADSEDDTVLPFMAPPKGAEPYHGFKVLTNVTHEGFTLGAITDFVKRPGLFTGDAFVVAPDGSRAGLEWRLSNEVYVLEMAMYNEVRWGVWMAGVKHPMVDEDAALRNLIDLVPTLEEKWSTWREGSWQTDPTYGRPIPHPHDH